MGYAKLVQVLRITILAGVALLVGCEPQATPIAGGFVTPTPTIAPTSTVPIRYALNNSVTAFAPNIAELRRYGLVEQLPTADSDDYDVVIGYGLLDNWQIAPEPLHIGLVINANLPPLNNENVVAWLRQSINSNTLLENATWTAMSLPTLVPSTIRQQMTQAQAPDGFQLVLAHSFNGLLDTVINGFSDANFEIQARAVLPERLDTLIPNNQAHMILVSWANDTTKNSWLAQVGNDYLVEWVQIPIAYKLAEGIIVTNYTNDGLPIVERQP